MPVCKQKDEAEPVPTVVGKELAARGSLSAALSPPPSRGARWPTALVMLGLFLTLVGSVLAVAASSDSSSANNGDAAAGVGWLVVGVAIVVLGWMSIVRDARIRRLTRQIWAALRYCHRDRAVFQSETGAWCYPGQFAHFLGACVGAARRATVRSPIGNMRETHRP